MANCKDCIHYKVCYVVDQMTNLQEYKTAQDLKDDCETCILTADVVPKSEYDNLKSQFEALDRECDRLERAESNRHDAIEQAKSEVAKIFEELYNSVSSKIQPHIRPICSDDLGFDAGFRNGKTDALLDVLVIIAELKKKYTNN